MDGHPNPKTKTYSGVQYSETRYAIVKWLERELPKVKGKVLNIASGNWDIPRKFLKKNPNVTSYVTYDKKFYSDAKNHVDHYGDVHNMPADWTNKWDCVICNQAMECFENPFQAMSEMRRVLKGGGILLIDSPFNYRWFGEGSFPGAKPKKTRVHDYWRITKDGWELLTKDFGKVVIEHSGPNEWDPYTYMIKCIK